MCGIQVIIQSSPFLTDSSLNGINKRGPDHLETINLNCYDRFLQISSSVLGMRGSIIQKQPIQQDNFIFCWNGEIYDGILLDQTESDTKQLFDLILKQPERLDQILQSIKGEFAFVLLDIQTGSLYYGRDCLGRRSLLISSCNDSLILSSVPIDTPELVWKEVECGGYFKINLETMQTESFAWNWQFKLNTSEEEVSPESFVNELIEQFERSIRRRLIPLPPSGDYRVAILFSGGLDCSLIAWMVDRMLPHGVGIDLLNVAFENKRCLSHANAQRKTSESSSQANSPFNVPDRLTAIESFNELITHSNRPIRLIKVNVSFEEYQQTKDYVIRLMQPAFSVMDLSIAIAVWHASKGIGIDHQTGTLVHSTAKIVFSGIGADEQFGGYSRHRQRFTNSGVNGLISELQLDLDRIWMRNLGRDDRCISDHGKEGRFPFLDEDFVLYSCSIPVFGKCNFLQERGLGDKQLLRLAAIRLGIKKASTYAKRAIQFGARTAKMEDSKESGTDLLPS